PIPSFTAAICRANQTKLGPRAGPIRAHSIQGGRTRPMRSLKLFALCVLILPGAIAQTCSVQLQLTPDYSFAVGSSRGGSTYSLTLGGKTLTQGPLPQLALFHYDTSS